MVEQARELSAALAGTSLLVASVKSEIAAFSEIDLLKAEAAAKRAELALPA